GVRYELKGSGALAGQGAVSVSGWLRSVGSIRWGHAEGVLRVTGPHGSVILDVSGPEQGAFAGLPGHLHFIVRSGTGEYWGLHAGGPIDLPLDRAGHAFTLSILA